jgi:hypothetical protein
MSAKTRHVSGHDRRQTRAAFATMISPPERGSILATLTLA